MTEERPTAQFLVERGCVIEGYPLERKNGPECVWVFLPEELPDDYELGTGPCDAKHYRVTPESTLDRWGIPLYNRFVCEHMGHLIE